MFSAYLIYLETHGNGVPIGTIIAITAILRQKTQPALQRDEKK